MCFNYMTHALQHESANVFSCVFDASTIILLMINTLNHILIGIILLLAIEIFFMIDKRKLQNRISSYFFFDQLKRYDTLIRLSDISTDSVINFCVS